MFFNLPQIDLKAAGIAVGIILILYLAAYFIIRKGEPVEEDDDTTNFYND